MKLLQIKHRKDWGHEWYVQILSTGKHVPNPFKRWTLLQTSFSWNDDASFPYFQITMGSNGFFSMMFWVHKFGFDIGFIERTWDWDRYKSDDENDLQ